MSILNQIQATTKKSKKRVGRGYGSGKGGHNSGRGTKGAGARKSPNMPVWFEGGQLPLTKRLPMIRGKSRFKPVGKTAEVNLGDLEKLSTKDITLETLKLANLIDQNARQAKIIATGKISQALNFKGLKISAGAKKIIEKAGGKIN